MNLPASELLKHLHLDAVCVSVRTREGAPCCELTMEALKDLVARNFVAGIVRGKKLREIRLTVPPDIAFRELGETHQRVKDAFHTDASHTTLRSLETLPKYRKRHHRYRCLNWSNARYSPSSIPGDFVREAELLTPTERIRGGIPLRPPMRRSRPAVQE